jgi:CheY-like chemotaxis protein
MILHLLDLDSPTAQKKGPLGHMSLQRPAKKPSSPNVPKGGSGVSALRPASPPTRVSAFGPIPAERRRGRILLVEPDVVYAQQCQAMLSHWFDAAIESNPIAALAILSAGKIKYDLVLCDADLQALSGLEFVRRMKEDASTKNVPAVIFNGEETSDATIRAIQAGVRHYVPNTWSLGDLAHKISSLLLQRR